jgi:hypothetical protein
MAYEMTGIKIRKVISQRTLPILSAPKNIPVSGISKLLAMKTNVNGEKPE